MGLIQHCFWEKSQRHTTLFYCINLAKNSHDGNDKSRELELIKVACSCINCFQFLSILSETQEQKLEKNATRFQDGVYFQPGHFCNQTHLLIVSV